MRLPIREAASILSGIAMAAMLCLPAAKLQGKDKPLTKDAVLSLLTGDVPPERVASIARDRGVAFEMTRATEKELRDAGADEELLKVLRELAPKPAAPPETPAESRPPSAGAPVLMIEALPGGAQVYLDDEPIGTTSPEGRLKYTRLASGTHRVRLSLAGYKDHEETVELVAGGTAQIFVTLQAATATPPPVATRPSGSVPATTANPTSVPATTSTPARTPGVVNFSVMHDHGSGGSSYCVGIMSIGNGIIRYQSTTGIHSFTIPLNEVKEARRNGIYLMKIGAFHIKLLKGTNYNFVAITPNGQYQPPDMILTAIDRAQGLR